ncbi:hypothetical protein K435DRAFT_793214 [Dendrothele bispora CBS 962.96]|uniref:Uncharacterized protein n=1 Tax=Dendrothele bispora (strain CBS 962.96) TaxID=1314807 RepID=A0A4S8MG18_DENBC|nr:hypothetical protein K435DRAFT_793214 [Dendrothele bispora CBS 962.96]
MDAHSTHIISVNDADYYSLGMSRSSQSETSVPPSPLSSLSPLSSAPPSPAPNESRAAASSPAPDESHTAPTNEQSSSLPGISSNRIKTRSQKPYPSPVVQYPPQTASASNATGSNRVQATSSNRVQATSIPKPNSENGRPGRGGYSLKKVLGWDNKEYKRAQNSIKKIVETTLVGTIHLPFTSQPPKMLDVVRNKMLQEFPRLGNYEDSWATDDFIRATMKNIHSNLRIRKLKSISSIWALVRSFCRTLADPRTVNHSQKDLESVVWRSRTDTGWKSGSIWSDAFATAALSRSRLVKEMRKTPDFPRAQQQQIFSTSALSPFDNNVRSFQIITKSDGQPAMQVESNGKMEACSAEELSPMVLTKMKDPLNNI